MKDPMNTVKRNTVKRDTFGHLRIEFMLRRFNVSCRCARLGTNGMLDKLPSRLVPVAFGWLSIGLWAQSNNPPHELVIDKGAQEPSSLEERFHRLRESLSERDRVFQDAFTVRFDIFVPNTPQHLELGPHTMQFDVTSRNRNLAIRMHTVYHEKVAYRSRNSGAFVGHDDDANAIISRLVEISALVTDESTRVRQTVEVSTVAPNGTLLAQWRKDSGRLPVPGRADQVSGFYQFEMAVGRGYSRRIDGPLTYERRADGLIRVAASGNEGGHFPGVWKLIVDDGSETFLVREALFHGKDNGHAALSVTTEGILECDGMTIAKSGTLEYGGDFVYSITTHHLERSPDELLFKEVKLQVNSPLPDGANVVDEREGVRQLRIAPEGWTDG